MGRDAPREPRRSGRLPDRGASSRTRKPVVAPIGGESTSNRIRLLLDRTGDANFDLAQACLDLDRIADLTSGLVSTKGDGDELHLF